jgi:tetratricopeptide (TPR) repeat protein
VALSRQQGSNLEKRREFALEAVDSFQNYLRVMGDEVPDEDSERPGPERVEQHILTLYLDSGQPERAVEYLEAKLEKDPRDLPALQMLSTISADRGDLETAAGWLRKRMELESDKPEAYYAYGVFAWRASYYNQTTDDSLRARLIDEGIRELETALRMKPDYFEALSYMTLLYREKAKTATDPAEIQLAETRAQEFHNRAVELRRRSGQDSTAISGSMIGSR